MFKVYRNGYITVVKNFNVLRLSYKRNEFDSYMKIYKNMTVEQAIEEFKKEINCLGY